MATRKSSTSKRTTPQPVVRPDEALSELAAALRDTMRAIAGELRDEKLFPFGITKISLSLNLPAGISATLDIEGPSTRSAPASRSGGSDTMVAAPFAGRSIDSLNLAPHALAGAQSLSDQFGADIVFTSGRRSVSDQCRVMAQNIVNTGNRHWIGDTYKQGQELQAWVDAHPEATSVDDLQTGLQSVMNGWDDAKLKTISYHLSGAAFDIVPVAGAHGDEIKAAIGNLDFKNKFIDGEGGVKVWHTQFDE